jgi:hypothetical protein
VHTGLWWRNLSEEDHLKDSGVDGRIILKWIFEKCDGGGGHGLDLCRSRYEQVAGSCEYGAENFLNI